MRQGDKPKMDRFSCETLEVGSPPAESLKAPVTASTPPSHSAHPGRRPMVVLLLGLLMTTLAMVAAPTPSFAGIHVGIFVSFGPPALPVYEQPPCPAPGYIWTPGYWAWNPAYGYYWVPGTWVQPPFAGALWTPGYWDYDGGGYGWHAGYWGLSVGWYGGIDYGFGYTGYGYQGGYWRHHRFYYNRAVNRIEGRGFHAYYRREFRRLGDRRVSYHGGPGGIRFGPTHAQRAAARERHFRPVREQLEQRRFALRNPAQRARRNHGRPDIAATRRPGRFRGNGVVHARRVDAPYRPPEQRMQGRRFQHSAPGRHGNNDRGFRPFSSHPGRQRNNLAPVLRHRIRSMERHDQHAHEHFQRHPRPQEMHGHRGQAAPQRHGYDAGHGHGRGGRR